MVNTGDDAQLAKKEKTTPNEERFLELFFRNQNKAVETFQLLINSNHYNSEEKPLMGVTVSGFFDDKTKKTIPFPTDWRLKRDSSTFFSTRFNETNKTPPTTYGSWINFLKTATNKTLDEKTADDNNFFWEQFFRAYLYFVGLSRTTPYSDESFSLFLENIQTILVSNFTQNLLAVQWSTFLQYLPGVVPTSVGEDEVDLTAIWNLDLNTLTLRDLNPTITETLQEYANYNIFEWNTSKDPAYKLNARYKDKIELLKKLVEQKNFWPILNTVLNNNLGIKFLFLNNKRYDLANLISSFSHYDDKETIRNFDTATNQFREELTKLIFANKRGIQYGVNSPDKLQELFDKTKAQLLTRLQVALETLQKVDPKTTQLPINDGKYAIDQLLQARTQLLNDQLDQKVINQIKSLFSKQIYASDIVKATNQLAKYKEILPLLTKLATDQKRTSLKINDQNYSFTALIADTKKQFIDLSKKSFTELQKLVEDKITLSQLETIYQESTETKSPTQESTNQNLAIGLGTAGGVVALAGAGGFAYWFFKIRKS